MWPYPWTHVGTPSHLGHMDRVAATMPSQAHAGAAQEAPDIGQWEGQDVPLVRPSSCNVKGGIPSSRRYLPTYLRAYEGRAEPTNHIPFKCNPSGGSVQSSYPRLPGILEPWGRQVGSGRQNCKHSRHCRQPTCPCHGGHSLLWRSLSRRDHGPAKEVNRSFQLPEGLAI